MAKLRGSVIPVAKMPRRASTVNFEGSMHQENRSVDGPNKTKTYLGAQRQGKLEVFIELYTAEVARPVAAQGGALNLIA